MLLTWIGLWQSSTAAAHNKAFPSQHHSPGPWVMPFGWAERSSREQLLGFSEVRERILICASSSSLLLMTWGVLSILAVCADWHWPIFWDSWWCEGCFSGRRGRVEAAVNWSGFSCEKSSWREHRHGFGGTGVSQSALQPCSGFASTAVSSLAKGHCFSLLREGQAKIRISPFSRNIPQPEAVEWLQSRELEEERNMEEMESIRWGDAVTTPGTWKLRKVAFLGTAMQRNASPPLSV